MQIKKTNTLIGHEFHIPSKKPYITNVSNKIPTSDSKNIKSNLTIHWKYSDAYFLSKSDFIVEEANLSIKDIVKNSERGIIIKYALRDIISNTGAKLKASYKDDIKSEILMKVATELEYWNINIVKLDSQIAVD